MQGAQIREKLLRGDRVYGTHMVSFGNPVVARMASDLENETYLAEAAPVAWYALRRTLPPFRFEENLAELIEQLPRYAVDELIVKLDVEEFSHGQPPLAWVQAYQPKLLRIREAMDAIGVVYSLNPWITIGHNDRGRDSRKTLSGLRTLVGHDGRVCTACACPLSEVWRDHVSQIWGLYAQTHPRVIWVEDDLRSFNHRPVEYSCFCEEHLARFSARIGQNVSREELVAAIVQPGEPHPWRLAYLDEQADITVETVDHLRRCVQDVDPSICLGLMSSGPRNHCLEGRDWPRLARTLAGSNRLYSRAPLGNYAESSLRGLYASQDSIKLTRHCLPPDTLEQTEVENVPFTQYANSAVFTFLKMALSFAYGSHGVTMNLFDHCGTPMETEPVYGRMMAREKPFFQALSHAAARPGALQGVQLLHHDDSARLKRLAPASGFGDLRGDDAAMMEALEVHGIATTYETSRVVATSGQTLRACDNARIEQWLHGGLLLDGVAAQVLVERGYGREIGLESIAAPQHLDTLGAFSAEECLNPDFGGAAQRYLTVTVPTLSGRPRVCRTERLEGAEPVSRLVDPDGSRHDVLSYAYRNALGGRIFVLCYDLASAFGTAWCHPFRRDLLQGAVRWLSMDRPPLLVRGGAWPLALRQDSPRQTLLGLFNFSLDAWPTAEFEFAWDAPVPQAEVLARSGVWTSCPALRMATGNGCLRLTVTTPLRHDRPLFVRLA